MKYVEESGVGVGEVGILHIYEAFKAIRLDDFCKVCAYLSKLGENVEGRTEL